MLEKLVIDLARELPPSVWTVVFLERWERLLDAAKDTDQVLKDYNTAQSTQDFIDKVKANVQFIKGTASVSLS